MAFNIGSLTLGFQIYDKLLEMFLITWSPKILRICTTLVPFPGALPWVIGEFLGEALECTNYWAHLVDIIQRSAWHLFSLSCDCFMEEPDHCKDRFSFVIPRVQARMVLRSFLCFILFWGSLGGWTHSRVTSRAWIHFWSTTEEPADLS